jgi:polyisoprenyl-phosphate glycosyltransferase
LMTGVLGEYVGRIYEEVKRRPLYTVQEECNIEVRSPSVEAPPVSQTNNRLP